MIVLGEKVIDLADQVFNAGARAAAEGFVGIQSEEALDLIQPRAVSEDEMDVPPGLSSQQRLHGRVVGAVDDHCQPLRDRRFDLAQEGEKFIVTVPRAVGEHRAAGHIQGCKERGSAVPFVVVRRPLSIPPSQRQYGVVALQGLRLVFLADAELQDLFRRVEAQAHHIPQILDEDGVGREPEAFRAIRPQTKQPKVAMHAGLGDTRLSGRLANASVRIAVFGLLIEDLADQACDVLILERTRAPAPDLIVQSRNTALHEACAPLARRGVRQLEALRHRIVGIADCAGQHDPRSLRERCGDRMRAGNRLQLRLLRRAPDQLHFRPAHCHRGIFRSKDAPGSKTYAAIYGTGH